MAAIAKALGRDDALWHPPELPDGADEHEAALERLRAAANAMPPHNDGLSDHERHLLAATHRPGDIASLVVTGLGRFASYH